ncbi:MAG: PrsW family intramembrane metalloprotease [Candidatus Wildermuthbacteria bacterium]|nr:PrsW family intramembrane metalloprotease [Candidatus Wildermuthbacteria bacterium]
MEIINYALFILFGFAPSILWLAFYLRKDRHPEPGSLIRKVFFWGMASTIPAVILELSSKSLFSALSLPNPAETFLYMFFGIAIIEEFTKFLVVRLTVYKNRNMDEPVDLMVYMIAAALGFAAAENMLMLFRLGPLALTTDILFLSSMRLVGATFLHALVSGLFGFFLALTIFDPKKKLLYFTLGIGAAGTLHYLFNFYILKTEGARQIFIPLAIVLGTAIFLSFAFKALQKKR